MAKVFISYSRKDIPFAKRLTAELQKCEMDFWIDWEGIPPTVDWWREIEKGIEEADVFLFLISPDSSTSKVCGQEIDTAVKNAKRIIPLVVRDIKGGEAPKQLSYLNWIFFRETDDFHAAFQKLLTAIHTDYEWVQQHRWLQVRALDWVRDNKDNSSLLRGKDLQDVEFQLATNSSKEPHPTDLQREYVFESRKATDRQRRMITGVSIAGIIALAMLALFGFYQAGQATKQANIAQTAQVKAEEQARVSRAGELAAQSVSQRDIQFDLSLLLSVEAFRVADTVQTRSALLDNTQINPQLLQILDIATAGILALNFSPNNQTLTSVDCNVESMVLSCPASEIIVRDTDMQNHRSITRPLTGSVGAEIDSIVISPDGTMLAFGTSDNTIALWDMRTQQFRGQPLRLTGGEEIVNRLSFSPDGRTLAVASYSSSLLSDPALASAIGSVSLWDLAGGRRIEPPVQVNFIPDSMAFSPDGKILAIGGAGTIIFRDMDNARPVGQPINQIDDSIESLAFSPDGRILASAGNSIILWDVSNVASIEQVQKYTGNSQYTSLAFSRDGKTLASGGCERRDLACVRGKISLWDVTGSQTIGQSINEMSITGVGFAFSPDDKMMAAPTSDNSIILWDITHHQLFGKLSSGSTGYISSVAFSPDGKTIASAGDNIVFWNVGKKQHIGQPIKVDLDSTVDNIAYSPNGKILALRSLDTLILWDINTQRPIGKQIKSARQYQIAFTFSPDGKTLVVGSSGSKDIIFMDVATGHASRSPLEVPSGSVTSLVFSPDGKTLVSAGESIIFWDVATGQTIGQPLKNHIVGVHSLDFSPDGKILASGSCKGASLGFCIQGEIVLWDVASRQPIGNPLIINGNQVDSVAFSPDGNTLATGAGGIILWELNPNAWVKSNCQRAGRNFTRDEWTQYFPGEQYRKTCNQWPLETEAMASNTSTP